MRVCVTGGRTYADQSRVDEALDRIHGATPIEVIIHGDARGADALAADWARRRGVPADPYPARWDDLDTLPLRIKLNKSRKPYNALAGFNRNIKMLIEGRPHLVVAMPGGNGTEHMRGQALRRGVPVLDVAA